MTLTEFLLARIAEDEWRAKAALGWQTGSRHEGQPLDWSIHMDRWSPGRVLVECDAKRRIVELHSQPAFVATDGDEDNDYTRCGLCDELVPCDTLRALALPYADHDDFQEEWRP